MKPKLLVLLVVFSLLVTTYTSTIKASTITTSGSSAVKVAVYYEAERIDSSEKDNIANVISVVESRFKDNIGYEVDLEIVGSWTSRKDTTEAKSLLYDAISKTSGVYTTTYDNCKCWGYSWKFKKSGYIAAIYVVEQDLTYYGTPAGGAGSAIIHAGIMDYNSHGYWKPFERLCSIMQHELSHIFGIDYECGEAWCVMNGPGPPDGSYVPYEEWFLIWKIKEEWATDWCQNCKQKLIQTYNGGLWLYAEPSYLGDYWTIGVTIVFTKWTEEWHCWDLTQRRLKMVAYVYIPNYPARFYHPAGGTVFAPGCAPPTTTTTTIVYKIED